MCFYTVKCGDEGLALPSIKVFSYIRVAQLAKHLTFNQKTESSSLSTDTIYISLQLNWIEHLTTNEKVRGSSPFNDANYIYRFSSMVEQRSPKPMMGVRFTQPVPASSDPHRRQQGYLQRDRTAQPI